MYKVDVKMLHFSMRFGVTFYKIAHSGALTSHHVRSACAELRFHTPAPLSYIGRFVFSVEGLWEGRLNVKLSLNFLKVHHFCFSLNSVLAWTQTGGGLSFSQTKGDIALKKKNQWFKMIIEQ